MNKKISKKKSGCLNSSNLDQMAWDLYRDNCKEHDFSFEEDLIDDEQKDHLLKIAKESYEKARIFMLAKHSSLK